ncbi:MAG: hypothetical protein C3F06_01140 [Candidatus Methanoperedenaceae archaeon]|nr:MAG: hypothetical protein C3F06_01140 [Candidatus Methanoperedenaceae archaeon]
MKNSIMNGKFSENDKIKCLLWCDRHCCLCGEACGTNIEIAHISPKGESDSGNIDNAIPLCFDCHSEIGRYNEDHPKGNKYKPLELKTRREQIYDKYTNHLVPTIYFNITQDLPQGQKRNLPDVGIVVTHQGDSIPVRFSVAVQVFLGSKDLGLVNLSQYNGESLWNLNPHFGVSGHFPLPPEVVESTERLELRVSVTVIDQYGRPHKLLPLGWIYMKDRNSWYLEPIGNEPISGCGL